MDNYVDDDLLDDFVLLDLDGNEIDVFSDFSDDENVKDGFDEPSPPPSAVDTTTILTSTTLDCFNSNPGFSVLTEAGILGLMEDDITKVFSVLSVPRASAIILLCHYNWDPFKVNECWFSNEDSVRSALGLFDDPAILVQHPNKHVIDCELCFGSYSESEMKPIFYCGHFYCISCLKRYVSYSIDRDGFASLMLQCPNPYCHSPLGKDLIDQLASDEEKLRYNKFLVESYIQNKKNIKKCPAVGCNCFAVMINEYENEEEGKNYRVDCACSHSFCWNCMVESHCPVSCETAEKWLLKNIVESEDILVILMVIDIEKSICFEKYIYYYTHWLESENGNKAAMKELEKLKSKQMETLSEKSVGLKARLQFLIEAWEQIIECRQVLKWSYAFGYYVEEYKDAELRLLEYMQNEAEAKVESLKIKSSLYMDLDRLLNPYWNVSSKEFEDFKFELISLTRVTRDYFQNMVRAISHGLMG